MKTIQDKAQDPIDKAKTILPLVIEKAIEAYRSGFEAKYVAGEGQYANIFISGVTWGYNTRSVYCRELEKLVDELNQEIRRLKIQK